MRVSGFTFIRNGARLGYPFIESIRSVLPLVDEFVIALGDGDDDTPQQLDALARSDGGKIRVIPSTWNTLAPKAFCYAAQSMAALYNCTGDWAFYIQGDEVIHEDDYANIKRALADADADPRVEGLYFDYLHFYGSPFQVNASPAWYRREVRIVRNKGLKVVMPSDAQYFVAIQGRRLLRYLRCRPANARVFHYGWARPPHNHIAKRTETDAYYQQHSQVEAYSSVDHQVIKPFTGTHPALMKAWVEEAATHTFEFNPNYKLTFRDRRQRIKMLVEKTLGVDWSKRHYRNV